MKELLIRSLLKWLAGITAEQWRAAIAAVVSVADVFDDDDSPALKKERWRELMERRLPGVAGWAMNLLREMAVAWAKKKGLA